MKRHNVHLVIHYDPVVTDDEEAAAARKLVETVVGGIDGRLSIHDFRMVDGPTHTNIIFDVLVPFRFSMTDEELRSSFAEYVHGLDEHYFAVIEIDKDYNNMA